MGMTRYRQGVLVSCAIPWTEDEQFDCELFRREVRAAIAAGFRDLYIFGTAGEGYGVTSRQFDEIARTFREETQGEGIAPMVGVIAMSAATTRERLQIAFEHGFRMFQIALPG